MSAAADLPEHVAETAEWRAWPRKAEAHLRWGVRERQVTAFVRNGKLTAYRCPDETLRFEPDAMTALFGPEAQLQGRARDLSQDRRRKQSSSAVDVHDPVALMFREAVNMMRDIHRESIGLVKAITEPVQTLLGAYKDTIAQQAKRIEALETHADESLALRSELADASQERELAMARHRGSEKRRDETLTLLKDQVPSLVKMYVDGESLGGWARKVPRDALDAMLESGALSEAEADQLRRAAGIPKPAPNPQTNGMQS